jgi:hypothetical protein
MVGETRLQAVYNRRSELKVPDGRGNNGRNRRL